MYFYKENIHFQGGIRKLSSKLHKNENNIGILRINFLFIADFLSSSW